MQNVPGMQMTQECKMSFAMARCNSAGNVTQIFAARMPLVMFEDTAQQTAQKTLAQSQLQAASYPWLRRRCTCSVRHRTQTAHSIDNVKLIPPASVSDMWFCMPYPIGARGPRIHHFRSVSISWEDEACLVDLH